VGNHFLDPLLVWIRVVLSSGGSSVTLRRSVLCVRGKNLDDSLWKGERGLLRGNWCGVVFLAVSFLVWGENKRVKFPSKEGQCSFKWRGRSFQNSLKNGPAKSLRGRGGGFFINVAEGGLNREKVPSRPKYCRLLLCLEAVTSNQHGCKNGGSAGDQA